MGYKRHLEYFKYIMRHKWYVLVASRQTGTSLLRGLLHDMSKFRPSEWFPCARCFYSPDGSKQYDESVDSNLAWLHHQKRNKHHWQYWVLSEDDGGTKYLEIPDKYLREMIADWMGSGRTITGGWEVYPWYEKNKDNMKLHPKTRSDVESMLSVLRYYGDPLVR